MTIEIHITPEAIEDLLTEGPMVRQCVEGLKKSDGAILVDITFFNGCYVLHFDDGRGYTEVRTVTFVSPTGPTSSSKSTDPTTDYDRAMKAL